MSAAILPLDTVKALLGIEDNTNDAKLTAALPVVTEYFENYCARGLAFVADVVEEKDAARRLPLFRFPVEAVAELVIGGAPLVPLPVAPALDAVHGFIYLTYGWGAWGCARARVTYSGGYPPDAVPADLADAYARCVADYAGVAHAVGGSTGGGAPLKSLGLGSGALTVSFETGTAAGAVYDTSGVPPLLAPYKFVLDHYAVKDFV